VDEVIKLAESDSGKYIQSPAGDYRIIKHRHWFIISPATTTESGNIIIEEGVTRTQFATGNLQIKTLMVADCRLPAEDSTACLDLKNISFPLLLRKWKTGDYFYPLGMKKKKKLSRFFIDQKLSKTEKENAWVIESGQRIIWVVGHRIDERVKITDKTKRVLRLTIGE
jgi:tRNA(Ile)-lysidine synthase